MSNQDIEKTLTDGPDDVAEALKNWRLATLNREKAEALLYVRLKGEDKDRSATEIKALIHADSIRHDLMVKEILAESNYTLLYERLLGAKKIASIRTAY